MSTTVALANRRRTRKIHLRFLKRIVNALLSDLKIGKAGLEINLIATSEMTRLNESFLRHAGSTDVITFDYAAKVARPSRLPRPSNRRPSNSRDGCATLHGEIIICVDEAVLQARKFGTSWQAEVVRYIIHGVLHLLGFDDSSVVARRKMKREENRLLREIIHRFPLSKL
jgi:probable rRNA maturation factor